MRAIAGIIAGLIVGLVVTIVIGIVGVGMTYSVPAGIKPFDAGQVIGIVVNMPPGPRIALLIACFGGALVGAAVAKLIARTAWVAWTVAGAIAAYVLLNVLVLPMPVWMRAVAVAAPLIGGLIANLLVKGATASEALDGEGSSVGNGEPAPPEA